MLMDVCTRLNAVAAAQNYWGTITERVQPDRENYHTYLRLLRLSRSANYSIELLGDMVRSKRRNGLDVGVEAKTFQIVMSTLVRSSSDLSSLAKGTQVMKLMQDQLETPDIKTAKRFIGLLRTQNVLWDMKAIEHALEALDIAFKNLVSAMNWGIWGSDETYSNAVTDQDPHPEPEPELESRRHSFNRMSTPVKLERGTQENILLFAQDLEGAYAYFLATRGREMPAPLKQSVVETYNWVRTWGARKRRLHQEAGERKSAGTDRKREERVRVSEKEWEGRWLKRVSEKDEEGRVVRRMNVVGGGQRVGSGRR